MFTQNSIQTGGCRRCGAPVGATDAVVTSSVADPLEVRECARCGALVSIGGRSW